MKKLIPILLFAIIFVANSCKNNEDSENVQEFSFPEENFIIGLASLIGTYFGVKLYHKIDTKIHKKILLVWYIFIFFAMIYKLYIKG